jgi:hypothetical protein
MDSKIKNFLGIVLIGGALWRYVWREGWLWVVVVVVVQEIEISSLVFLVSSDALFLREADLYDVNLSNGQGDLLHPIGCNANRRGKDVEERS